MSLLQLSAEEMLATTRSVRKRLDFSRPVEPEVIKECLEIAVQAPTGGNRQQWHFVVVTDPAKRQAIGDIYRRGFEIYRAAGGLRVIGSSPRHQTLHRIVDSSVYLAEHIHEA